MYKKYIFLNKSILEAQIKELTSKLHSNQRYSSRKTSKDQIANGPRITYEGSAVYIP